MDIDSMGGGLDFAQHIQETLSKRPVVIVLIGKTWLTVMNEAGDRRLDDPQDLVHMEVASALSKGLKVIPVLVGGAKIPRADELPKDLEKLSSLNAREISDNHFTDDVGRLIRDINERTWVRFVPMLLGIGLVVGFGSIWFWFGQTITPKNGEKSVVETTSLAGKPPPSVSDSRVGPSIKEPVEVPPAKTEPEFPPATTKSIPVKSELLQWILVSNPTLAPGDILEVKLSTQSSKVRIFGLFSDRAGGRRRVEGTYSKTDGGIRVAYAIPPNTTPGGYTAQIYVQAIGSSKEEIHPVAYEIVPRTEAVKSR
jgi:hypothetical protein